MGLQFNLLPYNKLRKQNSLLKKPVGASGVMNYINYAILNKFCLLNSYSKFSINCY